MNVGVIYNVALAILVDRNGGELVFNINDFDEVIAKTPRLKIYAEDEPGTYRIVLERDMPIVQG